MSKRDWIDSANLMTFNFSFLGIINWLTPTLSFLFKTIRLFIKLLYNYKPKETIKQLCQKKEKKNSEVSSGLITQKTQI